MYSKTRLDSGYQISDLETSSDSSFAVEASNWTISSYANANTKSVRYSTCAGTYLLGGDVGDPVNGGYQIMSHTGYFERTYSGLKAHTSVIISISFWFIDRWDPPSGLSIMIGSDGATIYIKNNVIVPSQGQNNWLSSICGQASSFDISSIFLLMSLPHTGSSPNSPTYSKCE